MMTMKLKIIVTSKTFFHPKRSFQIKVLIVFDKFSTSYLVFLTSKKVYQRYQMHLPFSAKCNPKLNLQNQIFKKQSFNLVKVLVTLTR